jgi:hypothetical protein
LIVSEKYRLKALACEQCSRDANDREIKTAWAEIAIEWHALSNRVAQETGQVPDHVIETD